MKNKKAILTNEVLGILIAVLCLLVLVGVGVVVYNTFTEKSDLKKAGGTLDRITETINSFATNSEKQKDSYFVLNPKDWAITSFENKLCLCEKKHISDAKSICCEKGVFREIKNLDFRIDDVCSPSPNIPFAGSYNDCIIFDEIPKNINFFKEDQKIVITSREDLNILTELLNLKIDDNPVKGLIEMTIRDPSIEGENENKIKSAIDTFLKGKEYWYLRVEKNGADVFSIKDEESVRRGISFTQEEVSKEAFYDIVVDGKNYRISFNHKKK